jgi:alkanesulfonate monooxygenase SsuD/methylene tetrahydromethanopterin reductase-like flavin-dependent oxidoreductase (luciferase family)
VQLQFGINVNTRVPILYPEAYTERDLIAMAQRVVDYADGWMTCTASPDEFRNCWSEIQDVARASGHDPASIIPSYQMLCRIDQDRATAKAKGSHLSIATTTAPIPHSMKPAGVRTPMVQRMTASRRCRGWWRLAASVL